MDKYIQIANTYLTRRLMMVIIVFLGLISMIPVVVWILVDSESAALVSVSILTHIFLSFIFGAHVKQQLARPEASLIPNHRGPHLIVAGILIAGLIGFICVSAHTSNQSEMLLMGAHVLLFGVSAWTASLESKVWAMVNMSIVAGFLLPVWFAIGGSAMTFGYTIPAIAAGWRVSR